MIPPKHIAFIMDGNGRWATNQGLPRSAGHKAGYEHIPDVLKMCQELGVNIISCYAWSTENWGRPKPETTFLLRALENHLPRFVKELHDRDIRFVHSGFRDDLTAKAQKRLNDAVALTRHNQSGIFNFAYNYGGRAEILNAARQLLAEGAPNDEALEQQLEAHLWTAGLPDVDLVIRTGGDLRLSNFMLWQSAYACLHVVQNYWPAITKEDIEVGIRYFNQVMAPSSV